MGSHGDVIHQMDKIKYAFQDALSISLEQDDGYIFERYLENVEPEFRSVAYEGIAMGLALGDLMDGTVLRRWSSFVSVSDPCYAPHIHVGLGWAIAKQKLSSLMFLNAMNPLLRHRVLDGHGYYDGIFKPRKLAFGQRPESIERENFQAYDQGMGRSLWYSNNGQIQKVVKMIQDFCSTRHADIWRGIGIACTYVGGCCKTMLNEMLSVSAKHKIQLMAGAALAVKARIETNSLTVNNELICKTWCNLSAQQIIALTINAEPIFSTPEQTYQTWVSKIEEGLLKVVNLPSDILN